MKILNILTISISASAVASANLRKLKLRSFRRHHDVKAKDAVFFVGPLLYHKFGNMVILRSGNLYSLCSPGNQDYQKIIHL